MRHGQALAVVITAFVLTTAGCGKKPPEITYAEGVIILDGEPLPYVSIQFVPELASFGSEFNSSAMSDDLGRFRLVSNKNGEEGAAVGWNRVVVRESMPKEYRGHSAEAQIKQAEYKASLKNRPIPDVYGSAGKTPLRIEVKADQTKYDLKLTRPKVDDGTP